jgi:hypothetical protein
MARLILSLFGSQVLAYDDLGSISGMEYRTNHFFLLMALVGNLISCLRTKLELKV